MKATHRECRNYAPVDVSKGLCHRSGVMTPGDDACCAELDLLPKCGRCAHYGPEEHDPLTGVCGVSKSRFMAYADMTAVTCAQFEAAGAPHHG